MELDKGFADNHLMLAIGIIIIFINLQRVGVVFWSRGTIIALGH